MNDRRLYVLIGLAAVLSAGHHVDHIVRGNHVGWPLNSEVNPFTYSLAVYPIMLIGLALYRRGKIGPGAWVFLSGGGALFIAAIHFGPGAVEPPGDIIDLYDSPILGWAAFGWLILFMISLLAATIHEFRLWREIRRGSAPPAS